MKTAQAHEDQRLSTAEADLSMVACELDHLRGHHSRLTQRLVQARSAVFDIKTAVQCCKVGLTADDRRRITGLIDNLQEILRAEP